MAAARTAGECHTGAISITGSSSIPLVDMLSWTRACLIQGF